MGFEQRNPVVRLFTLKGYKYPLITLLLLLCGATAAAVDHALQPEVPYLSTVEELRAYISTNFNNTALRRNTTSHPLSGTELGDITRLLAGQYRYVEGSKKPSVLAVSFNNILWSLMRPAMKAANLKHYDLPDNHVPKLLEMVQNTSVDYRLLGAAEHWRGFGTRVRVMSAFVGGIGNGTAHQDLRGLDNSTFLLMLDSRDTIFNAPWKTVVQRLMEGYERNGRRLMIGTEPWCCVRWLNHHLYLEPDMPTDVGCLGRYQTFMKNRSEIAYNARPKEHRDGIFGSRQNNIFHYLNAGVTFGRVSDFIELFAEMAPIGYGPAWDDQAKYTQLFYRHPDKYFLDYRQEFFSNSDNGKTAWWVTPDPSCYFSWNQTVQAFQNTVTGTTPVIIHTSSKHWSCYDLLLAGHRANANTNANININAVSLK